MKASGNTQILRGLLVGIPLKILVLVLLAFAGSGTRHGGAGRLGFFTAP